MKKEKKKGGVDLGRTTYVVSRSNGRTEKLVKGGGERGVLQYTHWERSGGNKGV